MLIERGLKHSSLHSPQILELSGIGRQDVLRSVGIPLRLELPGVGENVQEHISLRVNWSKLRPTPSGSFAHEKTLGLKDSVKDNDVKFWCFAFAFLSLGDITGDAEAIYRKAKGLSSEASGATDPLLRGRFAQYELQARRVDPGAHRPSVELIFIPPYGLHHRKSKTWQLAELLYSQVPSAIRPLETDVLDSLSC